jgi:osmoprotectant transport system permease protein
MCWPPWILIGGISALPDQSSSDGVGALTVIHLRLSLLSVLAGLLIALPWGVTATRRVVATATVAAYASLGGLGRYLIDGIKVRQFHIALVGALMVGALALILDGALAFAGWLAVPGTGRLRRSPHRQTSKSLQPSLNVDA